MIRTIAAIMFFLALAGCDAPTPARTASDEIAPPSQPRDQDAPDVPPFELKPKQ
jgi:hypothetical protein